MSSIQRRLPRHVDGRYKIGTIPLKKFLIMLPFMILVLLAVFAKFNKFSFFGGTFLIGMMLISIMEINNRETGLDYVRDMIKYLIQGDLYYERGCEGESINQRCIRNQIQRQIRK